MKLTTYKTAAPTDRAAVIRIIKGMREAGWDTVYREKTGEIGTRVRDGSPEALTDKLMECDDGHLFWRKGEHKGIMYFVFGNSPWEVMADSSCGTEPWDSDLRAVEEAINLEGV